MQSFFKLETYFSISCWRGSWRLLSLCTWRLTFKQQDRAGLFMNMCKLCNNFIEISGTSKKQKVPCSVHISSNTSLSSFPLLQRFSAFPDSLWNNSSFWKVIQKYICYVFWYRIKYCLVRKKKKLKYHIQAHIQAQRKLFLRVIIHSWWQGQAVQ